MFSETFNNPAYKPYLRALVVVGALSILGVIGYMAAYHREWFNVPFSKYIALKIALKALQWVGVAVVFWFGKKYFEKNQSQDETIEKTA